MSNLQINQFTQVPVRGQVEMGPFQTGVLSCQVSTNQATALKAGDFVTLDTTVTVGPGKPPQVIAGTTAVNFGVVIHSAKQDSYNSGDMLEIAGLFGPIVWLLNTAVIITPFTSIEDNQSGLVQAYSSGSNKKLGYALDYVPVSTLARYMLTSNVTPQQ